MLSFGTPKQKMSLIQRRKQFSGGKRYTLFSSNGENTQFCLDDAKETPVPVKLLIHPLKLSKSTPVYRNTEIEGQVIEETEKELES